MTLFALVMMAVVPLLVGGLSSARIAKHNTQAKALGQERLERMRNLPFFVGQQNGDFRDLLDIYFRDLQTTVTPTANDACSARSYDASNFAYTCTVRELGVDFREFTQVVRSKFVDRAGAVVAPYAGYNSQDSGGRDNPVSNLLNVEVTTSWSQGDKTKSFTVQTNIGSTQAGDSLLAADIKVTAINIASHLPDGDALQFEAGLVNATGSLTSGSSSGLTTQGARAFLASGATATGQTLSLSAPPGANPTGLMEDVGQQLTGGCALACFRKTALSGSRLVDVVDGLPVVSSSADPVTASLSRTGANDYRGFTYSNTLDLSTLDRARLSLPGPGSTVMVSGGIGAAQEVAAGSGYLRAPAAGANTVEASGSVRARSVEIFPTTFAAGGVLQLDITSSSLTCATNGATGTVAATYGGELRYWSQSVGDYVSVALPGTLPALSTEVAPGMPLSTWIDEWQAFAPTTTSTGADSRGEVSSLVTILTQNLRDGDAKSAMNITIGAMSCLAADRR